jgi:N-terminal domain of toast_rack, DUF2154
MNRKMIFLALTALALASLACSITINLPPTQVKTGPTVSEDIKVPFLSDPQATADVKLQFGAGNLNLQSGATTELISGTAKYNVADLKPTVTTNGNNITIEQGNLKLNGIPLINQNIVNNWTLSLANKPMNLTINAGAYKGTFELGGLSIKELAVTDGAAQVELSFSNPNQVVMSSLDYSTGASEVTLKGLANANATSMTFKSGAGSYTLDFSGQLSQDMTVTIESGVSTVTVIVPTGMSANVTTTSNLVTVNANGGWQQHGNSYQLSGSGHTINIDAKIGAGTLKLETSTP